MKRKVFVELLDVPSKLGAIAKHLNIVDNADVYNAKGQPVIGKINKYIPDDEVELDKLYAAIFPDEGNSNGSDEVTIHTSKRVSVYITELTVYGEPKVRKTARGNEREVHAAFTIGSVHPEFGAKFKGIIEISTKQLNSCINLSVSETLDDEEVNMVQWNAFKEAINKAFQSNGKGSVASASYVEYKAGDTFKGVDGIDTVGTDYISTGIVTVNMSQLDYVSALEETYAASERKAALLAKIRSNGKLNPVFADLP